MNSVALAFAQSPPERSFIGSKFPQSHQLEYGEMRRRLNILRNEGEVARHLFLRQRRGIAAIDEEFS
jgi:hypothetical protein